MKKIITLTLLCICSINLIHAQSVPVMNPIQGSNNVCSQPASASSFTASASNSPSSYNWTYSGPPGAVINNPNSSVTSISFPFPAVGTSYTLFCFASNSFGPSNTSSFVVNIQETPNVTFSGASIFCQGSSTNLSASSTILSSSSTLNYSWSPANGLNTTVGAFVNASPVTATNYTVLVSLGSCTNSAQLTVQPASITVTPLNQSVCAGSSANFIASGANSYTWNTGAMSSSLNVLPLTTTFYSVLGTYTNGCVGVTHLTVNVNTTCADVWPGDANRDGVVNTSDVLELGLVAFSTGAPRSSTSNAWSSHYANAWAGTVSTGWNKAHADCNGDGIVDNSDTLAIYNNFSLTHSFKGAGIESTNPDISLIPQATIAYEGIWNRADIVLGDTSNVQNQIYGSAFEINYDQNTIETDSVRVLYTSSFLSNNNQNINFGKAYFNAGKLYCATVRVDHSNVDGNGKIGEFWYKLKSGLPENSMINLSISNGTRINSLGLSGVSSNGSGSNLSITSDLVGIRAFESLQQALNFYPNPAKNNITLSNNSGKLVQFILFDLSGRLLLKGEFSNAKTIDLSTLESGAYLMKFESEGFLISKKLIIE